MSRDIQVLTYIYKNQEKIRQAVKRLDCDFSTAGRRSIVKDDMAFDVCAMYMAQIGENVKLLTDETREKLNQVVNVDILRQFRNSIDHNYENINRTFLLPYIQMMQSDKTMDSVNQLIKECFQNKKK